MNIDQIIAQLHKKVEIIAGFPKDKQVVYGPSDRKETPWEQNQKNPLFKQNKGGQTVQQVANWNEFGTKKSPARPFMRTAMRNNRDEIIRKVKDSFKIKNLRNPNRFDNIGKFLQLIIRNSIENGSWEKNAPITKYKKLPYNIRLKWKGGTKDQLASFVAKNDNGTKPLIDRGVMINNVNYEVKES